MNEQIPEPTSLAVNIPFDYGDHQTSVRGSGVWAAAGKTRDLRETRGAGGVCAAYPTQQHHYLLRTGVCVASRAHQRYRPQVLVAVGATERDRGELCPWVCVGMLSDISSFGKPMRKT